MVENTAFVEGVDPTGQVVSDDAEATVEVIVPMINLEKEVDETVVAPGTEVLFTFPSPTRATTHLATSLSSMTAAHLAPQPVTTATASLPPARPGSTPAPP